jgi:hypothetical protein
VIDRVRMLERAALAHLAIAFIAVATGDATEAISRTSAAFRLRSRIAEVSCRISSPSSSHAERDKEEKDGPKSEADPFSAPPKGDAKQAEVKTGADELAKDLTTTGPSQSGYFKGKHLDGLQWSAAEVGSRPHASGCRLTRRTLWI